MKVEGYEGQFLSYDQIIDLHEKIIDNSPCKDERGFIDKTGALFDGAINAMFRGFGGIDLYPSIIEKACILCFNIISFHCFSNANKRTGLMCLLLTLELNGIDFTYTEEEMFNIIVRIATKECSYEELLQFVKERTLVFGNPSFN
jgi:death-on-curing protein